MLPCVPQCHTAKSQWLMLFPGWHLFPCLVGAVTVVSAEVSHLTATRRWWRAGQSVLALCCHGAGGCSRGPQLPFSLFASPTGPCFFLSCPIGIEDFRTWFIDLWNNSIIPYLQEGAKDGLKVQRAAWHVGTQAA